MAVFLRSGLRLSQSHGAGRSRVLASIVLLQAFSAILQAGV